jgi:hypothetical protein
MSEYDQEVFLFYKQKLMSKIPLTDREKKGFLYWADEVEDLEMFSFVIDHFIDDKKAVPARKSRYAKPRRYCDIAYSVAYSQISGVRRWSENGKLMGARKISDRDEMIVQFIEWWSANKTNLAWSVEEREFYIPPEKEIGAGIIPGRKKNQTIPKKSSRMIEAEKAKKESSATEGN